LPIEATIAAAKRIAPTIIEADIVDINDSDVVKGYTLKGLLEEHEAERDSKQAESKQFDLEEALVSQVEANGGSALRETIVQAVKGSRNSSKAGAIDNLVNIGVFTLTGEPHSKANPQTLTSNPKGLDFCRLEHLGQRAKVPAYATSRFRCSLHKYETTIEY
jgi:hypothetical protein